MRTSNNFLSSTAFNLQPQKQIEVILLSYHSNLSAPTPDPPTGHPTPTTYHLITTAAAAAAAAASCHLLNLNQIMLTTNPRGSSRCETRDKGIDMVVAVPTMLSMHATVPEGTATATVNSVMSFKSPLLSNPSMHHLLLPPPPLPILAFATVMVMAKSTQAKSTWAPSAAALASTPPTVPPRVPVIYPPPLALWH